MPLQYNEFYHKNTGLTVGINKLLFSKQSKYQLIEVYETDTWGNLLTIDGMVMLSEKDEFVYHEMLVHTAMFAHPKPQEVLIIGGGDGGSAREVLKHTSVVQVDMVEIDETVIQASKKYLPNVGDWSNKRLNVRVEDGVEFLKNTEKKYDVIIIDGSDPVGPAEGLFEKSFIELCSNALNHNGILTAQTESPWVKEYHPSMRQIFNALGDIYQTSAMYLAYIPLYPAGMWSFAFASNQINPLSNEVMQRINADSNNIIPHLKYYNKEIHKSSFALPNFVADIIR